ncbi:nuclear transport factor 2 family protein [Alishewanella tabrizica]|uniref:DUF4440 domain-containing protein n=1 Tax=Alishewanella tabrizica TaxID=671278 RepID=A0ABQ2WVN0_9ALTE|nr:DUF4440 domain-containing protein [Alishewanella tabrizica]GGW73651.1 hypothetical protein GCM10008111_31950 [Alishewanella tabrizica]
MENLKATLIELEEHLFKAEIRASHGELDELIADEFIEIAGSGVRFGKKEVLERLPSELPPKISAFEYELRCLAPNCAQLLYKAVMVKGGDTTAIYSLRCSIWSLINGRWQMIFHQGTLCKPFES